MNNSKLLGKWSRGDSNQLYWEFNRKNLKTNDMTTGEQLARYATDGQELQITFDSGQVMTLTYAIDGDNLTLVDEGSSTVLSYAREAY